MINLKQGRIVCDDGFVISRKTKLDQLIKEKEANIVNTMVINHYSHICLRNTNVNDGIYDLTLCFNHKNIENISIIPMGRHHIPLRIIQGKYIMNDTSYLVSHCDEIEEDTRRWLNQYQSENRKKYSWGKVGIAVDLDRSYFIHVFMKFNPPLFSRLKQ
ncbi:MAG: hypothetical protein E7625_07490 [Ruminococcaceae bacterium]|nr:hypothetical protein [Oscillospiraceae bacterium]